MYCEVKTEAQNRANLAYVTGQERTYCENPDIRMCSTDYSSEG